MKPIVLQAMWMVLVAALSIGTYDRLVVRPALRIGVVDTAEVYRAKEAQFMKILTKGGSAEDSRKALLLAKEFTELFPVALSELQRDCDCVVIDRSAVVGWRSNMVDLTPLLKAKVKL